VRWHGFFSTHFTRAESIPLRAYLVRWSASPVAIIRVISSRCRCLSELTGGAGTATWAWGCSVALGSIHARTHFGGCGLFVLGWAEAPGCSHLRVLVSLPAAMATALEHPDVSDGAANHPRVLASLPAPLDTGLQWACVSCDAANQPRFLQDEEDVAPGFTQERDIGKQKPGGCSSHCCLSISLWLHGWA